MVHHCIIVKSSSVAFLGGKTLPRWRRVCHEVPLLYSTSMENYAKQVAGEEERLSTPKIKLRIPVPHLIPLFVAFDRYHITGEKQIFQTSPKYEGKV